MNRAYKIGLFILITTVQFIVLSPLVIAESSSTKSDGIDWRKTLSWHNNGAIHFHAPANRASTNTKKDKAELNVFFAHTFEAKEGFKSYHSKVLTILTIFLFLVVNAILYYLMISRAKLRVVEQSAEWKCRLAGSEDIYKLWAENCQVEEKHGDPLFILFKKIIHLLNHTELYRTPGLTESDVATELKNYPRYIRAAVNTYSLRSFNEFLTIFRVYKTVLFLEKNKWLVDDENELLTISGFSDIHELYTHVPECMQRKK